MLHKPICLIFSNNLRFYITSWIILLTIQTLLTLLVHLKIHVSVFTARRFLLQFISSTTTLSLCSTTDHCTELSYRSVSVFFSPLGPQLAPKSEICPVFLLSCGRSTALFCAGIRHSLSNSPYFSYSLVICISSPSLAALTSAKLRLFCVFFLFIYSFSAPTTRYGSLESEN